MSEEIVTEVQPRQDDCVALDNFDVDPDTDAADAEETDQGNENESADSFPSGSTPPQENLGEIPENNVLNKKRVSFPETLIISYLEPPDPWSWRHVVPCTHDQVLNAYKRSCEEHNIKPIAKVIQQLKAIENYNIRCDLFSLKGERLDHRHIEALEEVFRRIQFKVLDLEATHLDDEGAIALFEMIEYYESGCKVNLAFNRNIGIRGWLACSRMIKRTPCLESLDVKNCVLNDQSMPILGRSLRLGSALTILHMENCNLSGRPLMILVAALKLNDPLQELFLADNGLMPSDAIQLGNLLKFNHKLYLLDLRNNHLQDVGLSHLCDGLFEQNLDTGLNTLVLWNNQITFQGMTSLARALCSTKSLQTLNLGHNHITNEGVFKLKDGLLGNASLLRIGLQGCRLSCEAAIALAEFIADSQRLLRIDLRDNDIKTAGLMALAQGLRHSKTMTRLDLDKNAKKENGVKDYAEQQRTMQSEIYAVLERNRLGVLNKPGVSEKSQPGNLPEVADIPPEVLAETASAVKVVPEEAAPSDRDAAHQQLHLSIPPLYCPQSTLESPACDLASPPSYPELAADSPEIQTFPKSAIPDPPKVPPPPPFPQKKRKLFTVKRVTLPSSENSSGGDGKEKSLIDHIVQFSSSRQKVTIVKNNEEDVEKTPNLQTAPTASNETPEVNDSVQSNVANHADVTEQIMAPSNFENGAISGKACVEGQTMPTVTESVIPLDTDLENCAWNSAGQSDSTCDEVANALCVHCDTTKSIISESPDSGFQEEAECNAVLNTTDTLRESVRMYVEGILETALAKFQNESKLSDSPLDESKVRLQYVDSGTLNISDSDAARSGVSNVNESILTVEESQSSVTQGHSIVTPGHSSVQILEVNGDLSSDNVAQIIPKLSSPSDHSPEPNITLAPNVISNASLDLEAGRSYNETSSLDSKDLPDTMDIENTNSSVEVPEFHSDLSLLNMTEELEHAMESPGTERMNLSEADEFERELDEMLASVKSGVLLPQLQ